MDLDYISIWITYQQEYVWKSHRHSSDKRKKISYIHSLIPLDQGEVSYPSSSELVCLSITPREKQ